MNNQRDAKNDLAKIYALLDKIKWQLINKPYNFVVRKCPKLAPFLLAFVVGLTLTFLFLLKELLSESVLAYVNNSLGNRGAPKNFANANIYEQSGVLGPGGSTTATINDEKYRKKCKGARFEIMKEGTWFFAPNSLEMPSVGGDEDFRRASASGSKRYQMAYRSEFECSLPFVATISATPISGPSLGLFLEFENVFRFLLGDGDRSYYKFQQNDQGRGKDWTDKQRRKVANSIEDNKEIFLTINARFKSNNIIVVVTLAGAGRISETYTQELFPSAIDIFSEPKRYFRIGINDWRYKGNGSVIHFGTFSVVSENY